MAAKTYAIDGKKLLDLHFHATGTLGEHLWGAYSGDYIIVGVADVDREKDCKDAVFDVMRQLHQAEYLVLTD